jgi:hypothetical protein
MLELVMGDKANNTWGASPYAMPHSSEKLN